MTMNQRSAQEEENPALERALEEWGVHERAKRERLERVVVTATALVERHLYGVCDQRHYPEALADGCIYASRLRAALDAVRGDRDA